MHTAHIISYLDRDEKNFGEHFNFTSRLKIHFYNLIRLFTFISEGQIKLNLAPIKSKQELRHFGRAETILK